MIKFLIAGFKETYNTKKLVLIVFTITLIFGLLAALPFKMNLTSKLGSSPEAYKLLYGFDYTVYKDIMDNFGSMIKAHISQITWFAIGFLFFSMILSSGSLRL